MSIPLTEDFYHGLLGREPTSEDIANRMHLPMSKVRHARTIAQEPISLETPIGQGGDGRWLITCHAGCGVDAILAAVHLLRRDLSRRPVG